MGRVALESTSAAFQAAAIPSQRPTRRTAQRKGPASQALTPGPSDHRRSDYGGVRLGAARRGTLGRPVRRQDNLAPRSRLIPDSTVPTSATSPSELIHLRLPLRAHLSRRRTLARSSRAPSIFFNERRFGRPASIGWAGVDVRGSDQNCEIADGAFTSGSRNCYPSASPIYLTSQHIPLSGLCRFN